MLFFSRLRVFLVTGIIMFTLDCAVLRAQSIPFVPPSYNYGSNTYNAGSQNWSVAQDKDGVIYIANNDGLLSFDGVNWKLHLLPFNRGAKSVYVDQYAEKERIYVGSFEEFGYFEKNTANQLEYHSLKALLKNYTFHNDEIWTIHKLGDEIFFQSFSSYFVFDETKRTLTAYNPDPGPLFFFRAGNSLYGQFIGDSFSQYDGKGFRSLLARNDLRNDMIAGVVPTTSGMLLFLTKRGILSYDSGSSRLTTWNERVDNLLKNATINRVLSLTDSTFAIGTLEDGLYAFHLDGSLLWHLNKSNGLYNNTVLGLFGDREGNVWAALDNGISYIQPNSPFWFYEPTSIQIGLVEDMLIDRGNLYLATNQGVYKYGENQIRRIPGFEVQSWFIRKFDNQIFVGHNRGTSLLENDRNIPISESFSGGMDMENIRLNGKDILLQSTYSPLQVYDNHNGRWQFSHRITGFADLINNVEVDHEGNIWAGHMYKGFYRLRVDRDIRNIVEQEYYTALDSAQRFRTPLKIMKLRGRIVFSDFHKFYTYDDIKRQIVPFEQLNEDLSDMADTYKMISVSDTSFWLVRENEYTLVNYEQGTYIVREKIPFGILNNPPNKGRGNVYVDENGLSYFFLNGGIGKYLAKKETRQPWKKLLLAGVSISNRKKMEMKFIPVNKKNFIPYSENNLTFQFQYPNFSKEKIYVECFLDGYDSGWMQIDNSTLTVNYTNLPAGDYVLKARAVDELQNELSNLAFSFRIKTPWYRSSWIIVGYILLLIAFLSFVTQSYLNKEIDKKNKLFQQQEKERLAQLEHQEKLITQLKNEQLEADLMHKSKELANASMLIIKHEELLKDLKEMIQQFVREGKIQRVQGTDLIRLIDHNLTDEDQWEQFQHNFDLIHENFFRKLKEKYPALTPADLRLSALLRLNYSSKEIAQMLHLTPRGVEAARYRLRKKLALESEENLIEFMVNFK
ncbi:MAG: hypothetical protein JG772_773 [Dysgonamonadaceae bacterium]|nr:hypothetical protein [Dysgonamonadaceae bacterium]